MSDDRPTGVASCTLCRWRAQLTADTDLELRDTLRRMLVAHLVTEHEDVGLDDRVLDLLVYRGFDEDRPRG
jgi:hypothetical protein